MNDEQKNGLRLLLGSLVFAEDDVVSARRDTGDLTRAIDAREVLIDRIIAFVESFGGPITAVLDTTDPRAGLRRCAMWSYDDDLQPVWRLGYFIGPTSGGAFVEREDGTVEIVSPGCFCFTDIPESGKK